MCVIKFVLDLPESSFADDRVSIRGHDTEAPDYSPPIP